VRSARSCLAAFTAATAVAAAAAAAAAAERMAQAEVCVTVTPFLSFSKVVSGGVKTFKTFLKLNTGHVFFFLARIVSSHRGSAMAEGPRDALVSRNSATTKYTYRVALFA